MASRMHRKFKVTINFQVHAAIYGPIFCPPQNHYHFLLLVSWRFCGWNSLWPIEKFPNINQTEVAPTRAPISSQGPTPGSAVFSPEDGFQGPTFAAFELKTKPSEPPRWDVGWWEVSPHKKGPPGPL